MATSTSTRRPDTIRLGPWHQGAVYGATALLVLSGIVWIVLHYFMVTQGEFGETHHPLENWMLKIHGVGITLDGAVRQIQIINYLENYGYEVKGAKWREQFAGKTLADALELNVDIKNISGSTLSSRHVTEGVKRLLVFYQVVLRQ